MMLKQRNTGKRRRSWYARTSQLVLLGATLSHAVVCGAGEPAQGATAVTTDRAPADNSQTIIIGFLGGFVSRNSPVRSEVKMAEQLRAAYPGSAHVETFENRRRNDAYRQILKFIAADREGAPSEEQKRRARIILYGHSWGGTAAVALARRLQRDGIPVLLTVQIDSVKHLGVDDSIIPANVAKAANFYQTGGLLRGRKEIRAADPSRTRILGNYRYDYATNPVECHGYPFWDRWFTKSHMQIECDPKVWGAVESLIRAELPPDATQPVAPPATHQNSGESYF
jgi:pimeloyl-ACP methyl ester carboxylesterase